MTKSMRNRRENMREKGDKFKEKRATKLEMKIPLVLRF